MNTITQPSRTVTITRYKAAATHFLICILVATAVVALLWYLWYPSPYFEASGGRELLLILMGVDLVAGPLLTLIVFNPKKKSIKLDMSVIATLQIGALAYGLHVMYEARPVFVVFNVDRFDVVAANQIEPEDLKKGKDPELRTLSLTGPRLIAARLPSDQKERENLMFSGLGGKDLPQMPEYYVPYESEKTQALAKARSLTTLATSSSGLAEKLQKIVSRERTPLDQLVYLPVLAIRGELAAVLDKQGDLLEIIAIRPAN